MMFMLEEIVSKSPSRVWHAMNSLENSAQSLLRDVIICVALDGVPLDGLLNSGILFLEMVSDTGDVRLTNRSVTKLSY